MAPRNSLQARIDHRVIFANRSNHDLAGLCGNGLDRAVVAFDDDGVMHRQDQRRGGVPKLLVHPHDRLAEHDAGATLHRRADELVHGLAAGTECGAAARRRSIFRGGIRDDQRDDQ